MAELKTSAHAHNKNDNNKQQKKPDQEPSFFYKLRHNTKYQKAFFIATCLILPLIFYIGIRIIPTLFTFVVGFTEWNLLSTG